METEVGKTRSRFFEFTSDAYNQAEERPCYLNPENYGDDVAGELRHAVGTLGASLANDGVQQEDFGWYFVFSYDAHDFCVVVSSGENGRWRGFVERDYGLFLSVLGMRRRSIPNSVVKLVSDALGVMSVEDIHWHDAAV